MISKISLALLAIVFTACGKGGGNGGLISVPVSLDISDQTIPGYAPAAAQPLCNPAIPGVGNLGPDTIVPLTFNIRASQDLQGKSFIGFAHVELDHVTLRIIPPSQAGQTWDFLDSIKLFAQAVGSTAPPVLVAELDPV